MNPISQPDPASYLAGNSDLYLSKKKNNKNSHPQKGRSLREPISYEGTTHQHRSGLTSIRHQLSINNPVRCVEWPASQKKKQKKTRKNSQDKRLLAINEHDDEESSWFGQANLLGQCPRTKACLSFYNGLPSVSPNTLTKQSLSSHFSFFIDVFHLLFCCLPCLHFPCIQVKFSLVGNFLALSFASPICLLFSLCFSSYVLFVSNFICRILLFFSTLCQPRGPLVLTLCGLGF